ncbi:hypothetical protein AAFF_G00387280 [Aldrovandia affinis]|uniref:Uncharacterized protein n=1 Tax=Aldrovandia affinis TaxID=143900 RepID=A0AAD7SEM7_9TELE|nr:hypothetical protein AAFF_G00387280 [Aldrovandia affinis]
MDYTGGPRSAPPGKVIPLQQKRCRLGLQGSLRAREKEKKWLLSVKRVPGPELPWNSAVREICTPVGRPNGRVTPPDPVLVHLPAKDCWPPS